MSQAADGRAKPHPAIYLFLFMPFGISSGFVSVTLAYLLTQAGASVAAVAALIGSTYLPNTLKVLWAPLVDTTLTAKRWYMLATALTAGGLLASAFVPLQVSMLPVFTVIVLVTAFASTFCAMSTERLMAFDTDEAQKGRAGGWSQAGNLGGSGLGGGLGLWIATHSGVSWLAGASLGVVCLACIAPLLWMAETAQERRGRSYVSILLDSARDVWGVVIRRPGILACFICLLPIGTGAAQNLWSAIAKDWGAGADEVALIGGVISGVVSIIGSIAGGFVCDWIGRKRGYVLFGVVLAACALAMAAGPRTPISFMVFATAYNLCVGFTYGAFSALVLEAIGKGAAATKYNLIASLANVPIMLMTLANGWAHGRWGSGGMLVFEAMVGVGAVGLYAAVAAVTHGRTWRFQRAAQ
jgi:MFS transporter, PAT family, beta-lactamase induction signal transducer AmpG